MYGVPMYRFIIIQKNCHCECCVALPGKDQNELFRNSGKEPSSGGLDVHIYRWYMVAYDFYLRVVKDISLNERMRAPWTSVFNGDWVKTVKTNQRWSLYYHMSKEINIWHWLTDSLTRVHITNDTNCSAAAQRNLLINIFQLGFI